MTSDLLFQSATQLIKALDNKKISSAELVEETISHIESHDQKINAIVVRDFDNARSAAKVADQAISQGHKQPLLGLPMTVKESFNVKGLATTWGDPKHENWLPESDALAVSRLKNAGAIILGKTNVPYMLNDWQTFNEIYGQTNNPWNIEMTCGGSSGGAAAAVAAGFVPLELGSDLAGSLRTPAHFCGVYSHKPTQDLVPLRGASPPKTIPLGSGFDLVTAGPIARTAEDLDLALKVIAGPDELLKGKGYKLALPPARHQRIADFRVAMIHSHPLYPTSDDIQQALDELAGKLSTFGATVMQDAVTLVDLALATKTYTMLFTAFGGVNLPLEVYQRMEAAKASLTENDDSLDACYLRGLSCSYRDWFAAVRKREELRLKWQDTFKAVDVIICPVMPTVAFPHTQEEFTKRELQINGQNVPYYNQFIWASLATLLGLPATVVPIGQTKNDLPIGVQVIGDYFEDNTTIAFAKLLEREVGGFTIPPLFK